MTKTAHAPFALYSRGYLPHLDVPGQFQAVTFRLADSLPKSVWNRALHEGDPRQIAEMLDRGWGACYLRIPEIADLVEKALLHFDGERYVLHAWVVMPNHVHVMFHQHPRWPLASVLHSWKGYTATMANRMLNRTGAFWLHESYDRAIRDSGYYVRVVHYIHENPVVAKLVDRASEWRWSSADRWDRGESPPFKSARAASKDACAPAERPGV